MAPNATRASSGMVLGHVGPPMRGVPRTRRAVEIIAVARELLEREGRGALTMRHLAQELGVQAPSLYKHFPDKSALESAITEAALIELGKVAHTALHAAGHGPVVARLLDAYRRYSLAHPHLYRLATTGPLVRDAFPRGVETWVTGPWAEVTGDPSLARALWSFAHGMIVLELDGRHPPGSDLDGAWRAGAAAFQGAADGVAARKEKA